jgi:hypothetical protein
MLVKWMGALFAPKHPRHYTGRHRAPRMWWSSDFPVETGDDFR